MTDSVAGVVLAAGAGTRLAPLTRLRPKALCPVGNVALLDRALDLLAPVASARAVNAHHGADRIAAHLEGRQVLVSVEGPVLLGTAGALGALRDWIDERPVVVVNADAVHGCDLAAVVQGWDRTRVELVVASSGPVGFGPGLRLIAALLPWPAIASVPAVPAGLFDTVWRPAADRGELVVRHGYGGCWFDAGTPAGYLAANLWTSGGGNVVGRGAVIEGRIERCVVWEGSHVAAGESLVDGVRAGPLTVLVR